MNTAFQAASNEFDNPRLGRDNGSCLLPDAGVTQLVECDLAKVDVAGSNPVSRSNPSRNNNGKPIRTAPSQKRTPQGVIQSRTEP